MNPDDVFHFRVSAELHKARTALVELDTALNAWHKHRHPMAKIPLDLSPTQPLDPEVRAEIDATP